MYLDFNKFKKELLELMDFYLLQDKYLFYLWKPVGIPSSFGREKSVLDFLENKEINFDNFLANQLKNFSRENEYGLLNRLDNDTSGFLYFAKSKEIFDNFKALQKLDKISKIYYTKVENKNLKKGLNFVIDFPIMHKNKSKMIVIKNKSDEKKGRGKKHFVKTLVEVVEVENNFAWLKVKITKGIRHQIRVHLSSVGLSIVGDKLYGGKNDDRLHLFSVGIEKNYLFFSKF